MVARVSLAVSRCYCYWALPVLVLVVLLLLVASVLFGLRTTSPARRPRHVLV